MNESFLYIIKVNLILVLGYLFYWVLLRNEKFFTINRFILLGTIVFAFLLPLLPGTLLPSVNDKIVTPLHQSFSRVDWIQNRTAIETYEPAGAQAFTRKSNGYQNTAFPFSFFQLAAIIYILIAFFLFARFIWQLVQLSKHLKGNKTRKEGGIIFHETEKQLPPFSFFQHLVINKTQSEKEMEQIIAHEKVHIKGWHMVDILLVQLLQVAFWINPFVWMLNRTIRLNLEYIADETVLKSGIDRKAYQMNILKSCLNPADLELANLFNSSKIKLRIKMMNTNKTPQSHLYKYTLLLPFLLGAYFIINPVSAQTASGDEIKTAEKSFIYSKSRGVIVNSTNEVAQNNKLIKVVNEENEATPLILAAMRGDLELVKQLVNKGADVNQSVSGDGSPLIVAAKNGHEQIAFFLVEKGADINLAVPGDGNPLIAAAANGEVKIVSFLVERGAEVNAIVPGDETALINAAGNGHLNIVKYLVSKGADVNLAVMANEAFDPELRSPLNQAVKRGHSAVAAYLREKGAKK